MTEKEFLEKFIDFFFQKLLRKDGDGWEVLQEMIKAEIDVYLMLTHIEYYEVEFIKREHYDDYIGIDIDN
jgi:hypothetical protein